MKKTILYAAAFVAAVASCNKPEIDAPVAEEKVWVEFTTGAMTKVTREDVEGDADIKHKFVWEENDAITVNGETFTTTESGDKVTFGAEVLVSFLDATSFEAIYPASAGESFEAITVPATYETVPESGFYGIVAVAASENQSFQFKHATSFVKFQVPTAVTNVTISADEALAGVVSVAMTDGAAVVTIEDGVNAVTLSGEFVIGKDYYVPVLAGKKTNLTVSFDGKASKEWASVTLNQGRVANMGALPQPKVERGLNFSSSTATATYGQSFTAPTLSGVIDGVTYTSSNTSVATVDASTGKVTLVAGGTTTITASAEENLPYLAGSASYTLTVNKAARNLSFSNSKVTASFGDGFMTFTKPSLTGDVTGVEYESSDKSVATVNQEGEITFLKSGSTTIKAFVKENDTHLGAEATYTITVTRKIRIYVTVYPHYHGWDNWKDTPKIYYWGGVASAGYPGNELKKNENGEKSAFYYELDYSTKSINFLINNALCNGKEEKSQDSASITLNQNYYYSVWTDWKDGKLVLNKDK